MRIIGWVTVAAMLAWATLGFAGTERFDYDALGRLVRHIDSPGTVTEYVYDESWCVNRRHKRRYS